MELSGIAGKILPITKLEKYEFLRISLRNSKFSSYLSKSNRIIMKIYGASSYDPNRRYNSSEKFADHQTRKNASFPGNRPKHAYKLKSSAGKFYFLNRSSKSNSDIISGLG